MVKHFANFENVIILVSQFGKEGRHNVPFHVSRGIWKRYLKTLPVDQQTRVRLEKLRSTYDVDAHMKDIDVIVYIKGNEEAKLQMPKTDANKHAFQKFEQKFLKERHRLFQVARKHKSDVDFIMRKRNTISATEFVRNVAMNESLDHLKQFVS